MTFRAFAASLVLMVFAASQTGGGEAVNKLLMAHEQGLRSARLPLHRRLLVELQKLQTQHQKSGNRIALAEVEAEIAKVKGWVIEAERPVAPNAGPRPGDFLLVYWTAAGGLLGSWDNGDLRVDPRGFSWANKGPIADITHTTVLTGAFEAEIAYKGKVYTFAVSEADHTKLSQYFIHPPQVDGKHTIKVKRSAAGALTAEIDGQPVTLLPNGPARPDMHVRLCLRVQKDCAIELREMTIKDLSVAK